MAPSDHVTKNRSKEWCIRVDRSTWDRQLSLNPHALTIYLKFVPIRGVVL